MKTKAMLLASASLVALFSCETNKYTEQDQVRVTGELQTFVDSVETAVQMKPVHDWGKIDKRFDKLESKAEEVYKDRGVEETEIEALEERYEATITTAKQEAENFERTADMHMKNVEEWWDKKTDKLEANAQNTAADIEETTKESMDWLAENFEKLSDNTQEKFNEITAELKKD